MILAQLSDPHIVAAGKLFRCTMQGTAPNTERAWCEFDTAPYLARAVATLNALVPRPDIAVVTGDLVDHGEPEEYEQLRHLLARLSMPVFVIPGNHDAREPLREAFRGARYLPADGYLQYAIEDYPLRLVALDTLVPGKHAGMLCTDRLGWLDSTLAAQPDRPTAILMHHPPFATGITYMDNYGLDNAAGLAEIVVRHPQASCAATCTVQSTGALPARSPALHRARRTRSGSTLSPMHGSASSSSRPATSSMSGSRIAA